MMERAKGGQTDRNLARVFFASAQEFDLTGQGVHFFGKDYPHVFAVFTGEGPTIAYDVLLRDGYLRSDSPVSRAWEGEVPAAKSVVACAKGSVRWGGQ